jgi:Rad3-related DNA helicase
MQANDGLFGNMGNFQPPLTSDQFTETIVAEYADTIETAGIDACIGAALDHVWPVVRTHEEPPQVEPRDAVPSGDVAPTLDQADDFEWFPSYREHQREAVIDILHQLYVDDKDVVTLSAPTGAGKSLILHGSMAVLADVFSRQSFFTTPLNALIDQVDDDEFIEDHVITLKGKSNYSCVHPQDAGASVDNAICQRVDDFDCQYKDQAHTSGGCPYYGRKKVALAHPEVVTNLSYLMANSMIPETIDTKFDPRELLVIDECQSIEDFALQFIGVTVSQNSVPVVWDRISLPPQTEDVEQLAEWLEIDVLPPVTEKLAEFDRLPELTEEQADQQEDLQQFERKVRQLIRDVKSNHWVANRDVDGDDWSVEFEPIFVGRFLEQFLWSQGQKVILSSATIPKGGFAEEIGLDNRQVGRVEVESTFPTERRAVYTDEAVGKMTMRQRDQTIPKMARRIGDLADHYWDEGSHRGFVHCHSYKIMRRIYDRLPADVRQRTRCQDPDNREESLDDWLDAPVDERGHADDEGGQVFLSVAQDEGISLDDWRARWQVIAKASYPYMGPEAKRANYRMDELGDWTWYCGSAAINLQQAVGRGMRSKDDWCHTHVLDTSAVDMIERNEYLFEDWLLAAVDEEPGDDLPPRA